MQFRAALGLYLPALAAAFASGWQDASCAGAGRPLATGTNPHVRLIALEGNAQGRYRSGLVFCATASIYGLSLMLPVRELRPGYVECDVIYQMVLRLLLSAAGLGLATVWLEGVRVTQPSTLFWAALLLGIANTVVRPVLILLTLPATILTLGLFLFVVNAAMLGLVAWVLPGFTLDGFWAALGAWLIVAVLQGIGSLLMGKNKFVVKVERLKDDDRG